MKKLLIVLALIVALAAIATGVANATFYDPSGYGSSVWWCWVVTAWNACW